MRLDSAIVRVGLDASQIVFGDEPPRIFREATIIQTDSTEITFIFERTPMIDAVDSFRMWSILLAKKVIAIYWWNPKTGAKKMVGSRM